MVTRDELHAPWLFVVYFNDFDEGTWCIISKFANNVKLDGTLNYEENIEILQDNIERSSEWTKTWMEH